jgi:hypothetical protein
MGPLHRRIPAGGIDFGLDNGERAVDLRRHLRRRRRVFDGPHLRPTAGRMEDDIDNLQRTL